MSRHRFFLTAPVSEAAHGAPVALPLTDSDRHHAIDVLRVARGEEVVVVEPHGDAFVATVERVVGREIVAIIVSRVAAHSSGPRITLFQGVCKGSTMDEIVQHAVELGVERVVPLLTERTVVRLDPGKVESRAVRWRRIALGAARQSQRPSVPAIEAPTTLTEALAAIGEYDATLVLWEESRAPGIARALEGTGISGRASEVSVALVVGPEGGLTSEEVSALVSAGAIECSLGSNILRAETAALVALALAAHTLGGLGSDLSARNASGQGD